MYKSRLHFDYGNTHVSIDRINGEIVELYTKRNYDNILKNSMFDVHQPFTIHILETEKETELFPLSGRRIAYNPEMYVNVHSENKEDGILVTVQYQYLTDGTEIVEFPLSYHVYLRENTVTFDLKFENNYAGTVNEVRFPILPGIYLGDSYADDTLVYPRRTGMKIENPVKVFRETPEYIEWRWMEYRYGYRLKGLPEQPKLEKRNLFGLAGNYPSAGLGMSWLDLYDKDGGVYFGCHGKSLKLYSLEAATPTHKFLPGLVFASAFQPRVKKGERYQTFESVLYFHEGDWREGAKFYRAFRKPHVTEIAERKPRWMKKSAGLFAHYDFKLQYGGIIHKYKDIPKLAKEAKEAGFAHILLSGWHKNGFDCGYPLYYVDEEMGTKEEFIAGVKEAKEMGVHVSLYVNCRIYNSAYADENTPDKAVLKEDGNVAMEQWGVIKFFDMCPASQGWQTVLMDVVKRVTDEYGVDGIYFDQLNAGIHYCFNESHNHAYDAWAEGYEKILKDVHQYYDERHEDSISLMGEWVTDAYAGLVSHQLSQTFFDCEIGAFPELFRYTFPEYGVVDMIYPTKNLAMRANHVARSFDKITSSIFTNGSYFWVYDFENDNTFKRDEEGFAFLKELIALKKLWLERAEDYLFVEKDGIETDDAIAKVRRFVSPDKQKSMLVCYRMKDADLKIGVNFGAKKARAIFADGGEKKLKIRKNTLTLPKEKVCLIFFD